MNFRKVATDTLVSGVRITLNTFSNIIVIPIITKFMGTDKYGIWVTIFALASVFIAIGKMHLKGALIRYSSNERTAGQTFYETLLLSIASATAFSLFFLFLHSTIGILPVDDSTISKEILIFGAGVHIFLTILFSIPVNYPRAQGRVKHTEIILLIKQFLITLVLIPVLYYNQDLVTALWSMVAILFLLNVGVLIFVLPQPVVRPDFDQIKQHLRYSLPMVPKALSSRILTHADKYLILYFLSPTATGVYAVVYGVTTMLRTLSSPLNSTLYPTVTAAWDNRESENLQRLYSLILKGYSFIGIPAIVGLTLLAEPLLRYLSTADVAREGQLLVPILAIGFLLRGYENSFTYVLKAAEETWRIGLIIVVAMVLNLCLNVILIPTAGLKGAALATLTSHILIASYIIYHSLNHFELSIPFLDIGRSIFASGVMAFVLVTIPVPSGIKTKLVLYPVAGVLIYAVTIVLVGGVNRAEINMIRLFISDLIDIRE